MTSKPAMTSSTNTVSRMMSRRSAWVDGTIGGRPGPGRVSRVPQLWQLRRRQPEDRWLQLRYLIEAECTGPGQPERREVGAGRSLAFWYTGSNGTWLAQPAFCGSGAWRWPMTARLHAIAQICKAKSTAPRSTERWPRRKRTRI